jgi:hypothetical protein
MLYLDVPFSHKVHRYLVVEHITWAWPQVSKITTRAVWKIPGTVNKEIMLLGNYTFGGFLLANSPFGNLINYLVS